MRLKERIEFYRPTTEPDEAGGYDRTEYVKQYECWANVDQDNSAREMQSMQTANMVIVKVTIRYNPAYVPGIKDNIKWGGVWLTIHGEPDRSERNWLKFRAAYDPNRELPEID
ncbi:MAG: head-tail adaptor protein [Cryomorphaceae bacterium]|nr:MAG: head-tail adaptor protein [Cryomorphaceae bacterium]